MRTLRTKLLAPGARRGEFRVSRGDAMEFRDAHAIGCAVRARAPTGDLRAAVGFVSPLCEYSSGTDSERVQAAIANPKALFTPEAMPVAKPALVTA